MRFSLPSHLAISGDIFGHHNRRESPLTSSKHRQLPFYRARSKQLFGPKLLPQRLRNPVLKPVTSCCSLFKKPTMAPCFSKIRESSNGTGGLNGQSACQLWPCLLLPLSWFHLLQLGWSPCCSRYTPDRSTAGPFMLYLLVPLPGQPFTQRATGLTPAPAWSFPLSAIPIKPTLTTLFIVTSPPNSHLPCPAVFFLLFLIYPILFWYDMFIIPLSTLDCRLQRSSDFFLFLVYCCVPESRRVSQSCSIDILSRIIPCCGGWLGHPRIFSSMSGLCLLEAVELFPKLW